MNVLHAPPAHPVLSRHLRYPLEHRPPELPFPGRSLVGFCHCGDKVFSLIPNYNHKSSITLAFENIRVMSVPKPAAGASASVGPPGGRRGEEGEEAGSPFQGRAQARAGVCCMWCLGQSPSPHVCGLCTPSSTAGLGWAGLGVRSLGSQRLRRPGRSPWRQQLQRPRKEFLGEVHSVQCPSLACV